MEDNKWGGKQWPNKVTNVVGWVLSDLDPNKLELRSVQSYLTKMEYEALKVGMIYVRTNNETDMEAD